MSVSLPASVITATATDFEPATYQKMCLNIEKKPGKDISFAGKIILHTTEINSSYQKVYVLSPSDGGLSLLVDKAYGNLIVSPDGKWLAYSPLEYDTGNENAKSFRVISIDGKQKLDISYGEKDYGLFDWLDNHRVVLSSFGDDLLVADILTGQVVKIGITSPELAMNTNGLGFQAVNPALDRMIYYRNIPAQEFPSAVLWDVENKKVIWRLELGDELVWHNLVQWSPDGSQFVIAGPVKLYDPVLELFLVDRDGQAKQLTHLRDSGVEHGIIDSPTWSPDGRHIAFWLENSLAVFDSATEKVTDYCILAIGPNPPPMHWSPDSRQIVLHGSADSDGPKPVIVVDIKENKAVEVIGNEYSVEGWMVDNP